MTRTTLTLLTVSLLSSGCFSEPLVPSDTPDAETTAAGGPDGEDEDYASSGEFEEEEEGSTSGGWEDEEEEASTGEVEDDTDRDPEDPTDDDGGGTGGMEDEEDPFDCVNYCLYPSDSADYEFTLPLQEDATVPPCASAASDTGSFPVPTYTVQIQQACIPAELYEAYDACEEEPFVVYTYAVGLRENCHEQLQAMGCDPEHNLHGLGYEEICETYLVEPYIDRYTSLPPQNQAYGVVTNAACHTTVPDPLCE